jgi:hypothetical protein
MFGKYAATAFEVEAERRREVIAATRRDARRSLHEDSDESLESTRWTTPTGRGLAWLAATLFARIVQRT